MQCNDSNFSFVLHMRINVCESFYRYADDVSTVHILNGGVLFSYILLISHDKSIYILQICHDKSASLMVLHNKSAYFTAFACQKIIFKGFQV